MKPAISASLDAQQVLRIHQFLPFSSSGVTKATTLALTLSAIVSLFQLFFSRFDSRHLWRSCSLGHSAPAWGSDQWNSQCSFTHSFIHLMTHSFIHSLPPSFIPPSFLTHPLINRLTHSHSLINSLIYSFTHPFANSILHSSAHSFTHWPHPSLLYHSFMLIHSLIFLFIHLLTHLPIHLHPRRHSKALVAFLLCPLSSGSLDSQGQPGRKLDPYRYMFLEIK